MSIDKCDSKVFKNGKPLLLVDTWSNSKGETENPCRATGFDEWVQKIAKASKQKVDWHYSGGIAQVLCLGDRDKIIKAIDENECSARILRILGENASGLYRNGVTPVAKGSVAAFWDGGESSCFVNKNVE